MGLHYLVVSRTVYSRSTVQWCLHTFSSGSEGGTGVSGLSGSADLSFFLSPFLSFPFPVPGSPDFGRRGTNGMLGNKRLIKRLSIYSFKGASLVPFWFITIYLVFSYLSKLLFSVYPRFIRAPLKSVQVKDIKVMIQGFLPGWGKNLTLLFGGAVQ